MTQSKRPGRDWGEEGTGDPGALTHGRGAAILAAVGEKLVEDDPEAPDVRLAREDVVGEGLWGVPGGGTRRSWGARVRQRTGKGTALGEGSSSVVDAGL